MHTNYSAPIEMQRPTRLASALLACESYALRNPLRFAALAVLALLSISVVALRISYETNDDVFMTMIVSGRGLSAQPDAHLLFSNILVGEALKHLYTACPQFPWYGVYLLLGHYLAQVAILYCALAVGRQPEIADANSNRVDPQPRRSFRLRFASYLLLFAVVELVLLNSLQFTSTAFVVAQAGVFFLCLAVERLSRRPPSQFVGPLCSAVVLVVLASLIRMESLILASLVSAPLFVFYCAARGGRRAIVPVAAAIGVAGLLVVSAASHNRSSYASDVAWSWFYDFNKLRCTFNDYGWTSHTPETAPIFTAVGWSKNDHDMLARWYFDDSDLYSEDNLRSVVEAYPWRAAHLTPSYLSQLIRRPLRDRALWWVTLTLPFMLVLLKDIRRARTTILVTMTVALALYVAIGLSSKVPPLRIYLPLLAFPLSATLLFPTRISTTPTRENVARRARGLLGIWRAQTRLTRVVTAMLIVGTSMGVYRQINRSRRIERDRATFDAFVASMRSPPQCLYVCWEAALPFELISPLDNLDSWRDIPVFSLAWAQRTPWSEEMKRGFGISNLAKAISERSDIVLVATETHRSLFQQFATEHFATSLTFVPEQEVGRGIVAGRYQTDVTESQAGRKQSTTIR